MNSNPETAPDGEEASNEEALPEKRDRWPATAYLNGALHAQVRLEAAKRGQTMSDWIRLAIQTALQAAQPKPAPPPRTAKAKLQRFLDNLAEHYHLGRSAKEAGASNEQLQSWLQDEAVSRAVTFYQHLYLEKIEEDMVAYGKGLKSGSWQALVAFLNAHHPQYGIKAELLSRIVGDIIDRFERAITEELNPQHAAKVVKILREQAKRKELQFK